MPVVATTYGSTAHISPLLHKLRRLGLRTPDALLHVAVARGCSHYTVPDEGSLGASDPGLKRLSDAELGIAMISGAQEYSPQLMRCAAQLLSGPDIEAPVLARMACMERCAPLLRYIAEQARQWDEGREWFWKSVIDGLPSGVTVPPGLWPHPSRFMLQAGYRRGGGVPKPVWLRPRARKIS